MSTPAVRRTASARIPTPYGTFHLFHYANNIAGEDLIVWGEPVWSQE